MYSIIKRKKNAVYFVTYHNRITNEILCSLFGGSHVKGYHAFLFLEDKNLPVVLTFFFKLVRLKGPRVFFSIPDSKFIENVL